jgi:endonuclease YncB( thermonuclease family)
MIFLRIQALLLLLSFSLWAEEIVGRVVRVADGDTITVLTAGNMQEKIRFHGIDAPEKGQAFGQKSKRRLSDYVFGKDVTVTWKSKDKYGRILGTVWLGSTDINLQMLRDGYAWHYKRFDSNPTYAAAELEARQNRRGLWSDPNPIPPEQFRHNPGGSRSVATAPSLATTGGPRPVAAGSRIEYRAGNAMPVGSRTPAPINSIWPDTGYWLSTNSNKRHNRNCENYRKTRGYPCQKNEGERCGKCGG